MRGLRLRRGLGPLVGAAWMTFAATSCGNAQQSGAAGASIPDDPAVVAQRADRARVMGDSAAPIRMIEVSDFECPYCARYYRDTFHAIDSLYVETGKVSYVWVSFPNPSHLRSWRAIEAGFCAAAAGHFWPMHDLLFENQDSWAHGDDPEKDFEDYARKVGVDEEAFRRCTSDDLPASLQTRDLESVVRAGIGSTPFFIIADSASIQGAAPLEKFRAVLDSVLARKKRAKEPPEKKD